MPTCKAARLKFRTSERAIRARIWLVDVIISFSNSIINSICFIYIAVACKVSREDREARMSKAMTDRRM